MTMRTRRSAGSPELSPSKKRKTWSTSSQADMPPPRKRPTNRRLPSAKEIKKMMPKKLKTESQPKEVEDELPKQLNDPEEGYWDDDGQWVDANPRKVVRKEESKIDDAASSPDEASSRLVPPIMGHRVNTNQRAINQASMASTSAKPDTNTSSNRPISPGSLRQFYELASTDISGRTIPQQSDLNSPGSPQDAEDVEMLALSDIIEHRESQPRPRGTVQRPSASNSRVPDSVALSISSSHRHRQPQGNESGPRVVDSFSCHSKASSLVPSSGMPPPAQRQPPTQPSQNGMELEDEEQDELDEDSQYEDDHEDDKENVNVVKDNSEAARRVKTYSRRVAYAYRLPEQSRQREYSKTEYTPVLRDRTAEYSNGPLRHPSPLQDREEEPQHPQEDDGLGWDELIEMGPNDDDPNDLDWQEELQEAMFQDSLTSWDRDPRPKRTPPRLVPVSTAFRANGYQLPQVPEGYRFAERLRPRRRVREVYVPVHFENDHEAKLRFTQSFVEYEPHGQARNKPARAIPIIRRKHKVLPYQRYHPGHTLKPIKCVTIEELRERYRVLDYRMPIDARFLKYATRPPPRKPRRGREIPRHPAEPRIVHPSDVPSEEVSHYTPTVPYPDLGHLSLRRAKNGTQSRGPRLQFTAQDPPTPAAVPTTATNSTPQTRSRATASGPLRPSGTALPSQVRQKSRQKSHRQETATSNSHVSSPFVPQHPNNPPRRVLSQVPRLSQDEPNAPDVFIPDDPAPTVRADEEDDLVELQLPDGGVVFVPRAELEALDDDELDRLSYPSASRHDPIKKFEHEDLEQPRPVPTQSRPALGDITSTIPVTSGRMSGVDITQHLLDLASRLADDHPPVDHRHRRRDKQRIDPDTPGMKAAGSTFASTAPPKTPGMMAVHPAKQSFTRSLSRTQIPPAPLVLPSMLYPHPRKTALNEDQPKALPPRRAKSAVNTAYKKPSRVNCTPSPEPTAAAAIAARLAQSIPAFAAVFPPPVLPPPPRLGIGRERSVRLMRTRTVA